jgi:hypothetical protein
MIKSILYRLAGMFFLAGFVIAPAGVSWAAPATLRPRFTVELNVQASETSKEALISDMTSALKKLSDVEVTSDGTAVWMLYINVAPIMDKAGLKGYAISTVIADQNSSKTLKALPPEDFKTPAAEQTVKDLAIKLVDVRDHLLLTCTVDGLPKAYAQIVDYFNDNYLVPVRETIDNYNFDQSGSMRRGF